MYKLREYNIASSNNLTLSIDKVREDLVWGDKGGGGGGSTNLFDELDTRKEFKDTAFWQTEIKTGKDGKATLDFELPDNLTTWVIVAKASSGEDLFGQEKVEIISNLNYQIFPSLPRFVTYGDKLNVGALLQNNTDKDIDASIEIISNVSGNEEVLLTEPITIAANKGEIYEVAIEATSTDPLVKFQFNLYKGEEKLDSVLKEIPLNFATHYETNSTTGKLNFSATEIIEVSDDAIYSNLDLEVTPSLAKNIGQEKEYITKYNYYCTDQTSSKLISYLGLRNLNDLDGLNDKEVSALVSKLYDLQLSSGGWDFWNKQYSQANIENTAYALYALYIAEGNGISVSSTVVNKGVDRLEILLKTDKNSTTLTSRALGIYVTSLYESKSTESLINNIYDKVYDNSAKAWLVMSLDKNSSRYDELMNDLINSGTLSAGLIYWESNDSSTYYYSDSNENVTATVLLTLIRDGGYDSLTEKGMMWLRDNENNNYSTFSVASVINTVSNYRIDRDEIIDGDIKFSALLNNKDICIECSEESLTVGNLDKLNELTLYNFSNHNQYYRLNLNTYPDFSDIRPVSHGFTIFEEIESIDGVIENIKEGDIIKHTLYIISEGDYSQVLVEAPIAAGYELVNFNLGTVDQSLKSKIDNDYNYFARNSDISNNSYTNLGYLITRERLLGDRVGLLMSNLPKGAYKYEYLTRATFSGEYNVNPPKVNLMYSPDVFGIGKTAKVMINEISR
ncbi:MAG: alpha-2-macroglobulin family protein [Candidatus Dojkabacteria bacterium]|nr:alpha-2-macroglobulin family protein [Candidatus Dojkabacteria bacterium]MDQ7021057.1 alpha-2-macroglobulin family protein [Candidatus Dojkabacteria bacterium]